VSLAQALSTYVNLNLLVALAISGSGICFWFLKKLGHEISSRAELTLHYFLLSAILILTFIHPFLPRNEIFAPAARVWSASSIKNFSEDYTASDKGGYLAVPALSPHAAVEADQVTLIWLVVASVIFLGGAVFIFRDLKNLMRIRRKSFLVKRVGAVRILLNDDIRVPFSYWLPFQANVVLPLRLLQNSQDYKIALTHELQHHRQRDTRWVYVLWGLKLFCLWNPFIYFWNRWICEVQEFACDETLVDQNKVESQAYARCLVEVAQSALDQEYVPACATGLVFLVERHLLQRRIEKMLTRKSTKLGWSIRFAIGAALLTAMTSVAFAAKGLVQDRRVNLAQATAMAAKAQSESGFPVVVNDLVVKELNRYIGTPEGRDFMRNALQRMEDYKPLVQQALQKYGMPTELMAVPIIESGYQNLPQNHNPAWPTWRSAGLWQFIASTARNYGLRVDNQKDERLDTGLLTDAAMRLILADKLRFGDWQLAMLAYNVGEVGVQQGIDEMNTRDAWTLIRAGHENDKDYLPKLMAAILIMRNPESVN